MSRFAPLAVLAAAGLAGLMPAGEFNKKLSVGDPAPAWAGLPGTDGKAHSLADLNGKQAVVLVFTCNSCPVAVGYEGRIVTFAKQHTGADSPVALVAVNVNTIEEDRLPKMKERAKEQGFTFPYLYDETQKIARDYGATTTPEFFVLDKDRKIAYMGAMDDAGPPATAAKHFVVDAVQTVLKGGKPAVAETFPRGCMIRSTRPKR
jgi:peroxiredoxin